MRTPLIAGNWKMNGTKSDINQLVNQIKQGLEDHLDVDLLICPTFIHLTQVRDLIAGSPVLLGAQNLYPGSHGAFTGEVSGVMLREMGCQYVIIGHSERRALFYEGLSLVAKKFQAAYESGLKPILCVGETQAERELGKTETVVTEQIMSVIDQAGLEAFQQAVIAYEPVWAIGTGLTATPQEAQTVHAMIRQLISQKNVDLAAAIRILYGGSMKADNAFALLAQPDIDGGLIGGASLDANQFLTIAAAADKQFETAKTIN